MENQPHSRTLNKLRNILGLSGNELAKVVGVPRAKIENVERGKIKLDADFASRIQAATGVSAQSLMRGDSPVLTISGKAASVDLFNKWRSLQVDSEDRKTQKEELHKRISLLLDAAAEKSPGELRKVYSRLCDTLDFEREETGITFSELFAQARKSASIDNLSMSVAELDKVLGEAPLYKELRQRLLKRGKINVVIEKFPSWVKKSFSFENTISDSLTSNSTVYRIQCEGTFHEVIGHHFTEKLVG
jgi:transcriptional regulator with XRE-family HTH domain